MMWSRFRAAALLLAMVMALPVLAVGVAGALSSNTNDPRQWLPRGFPETDRYEWFRQHFGRGEITVVSWPGCTLGDERIGDLARAMVGPSGEEGPISASGPPAPRYFEKAITAEELIGQLTSPPLEVPYPEALRRLEGVLLGPDRGQDPRTTCLVLLISEEGAADRVAAVEQIRRTAHRACGLTEEQLRLAGPTVDAATIDVESQRLLLELAYVSGAIAFGVTWWRLRSFRLAVTVMVGAVYCAAVALAILYFTGGKMNLVMTMLPPLIYVLGISAAVHLVNYYRDALAEGPADEAPGRAVADGWRPCVLAAGTTAIGLASLSVSKIVPVRDFGIYSGVGMVASVGVLFALLPAVWRLWPLPAPKGPAEAGRPGRLEKTRRRTAVATRIIRGRHALLTTGSLAAMAVLGVGLASIRSTVKLQHRFAPDSKIISDYRWLERNLGPSVPLEIVVHFPEGTDLDFLARMELVGRIEREVAGLADVGATMSPASFAPVMPEGGSARDVVRRRVMASRLARHRDVYVEAGYLADGDGDELWRVSVQAYALGDVDYGRFTSTLRGHVDPILAQSGGPGVKATYTGVIPLIYKAQRQLFGDLKNSFFLAFGVIAVVMVVALKSPGAGLLAMLPNLFPAVVVFGFMGWTGLLIEIGSVMTASAALGIAVDDTFHYLTWFRRGVARGMSARGAIRFACQRCAAAMIHTTVICSAGLAVFALSSFMPIVHFAWLMVALLVAALVGDLVFLPAMLSGPLGRVFAPRPNDHPEPAAEPEQELVGTHV
jgi:predicted RND superfamily exporter protein